MKPENCDDNIILDQTNSTETTPLTSNSSLWNGREIGVWEKSWGNCCSCCCNPSCVLCTTGATTALGCGIFLCMETCCATNSNPILALPGSFGLFSGIACFVLGLYKNATYIPPSTWTERHGNYEYTYQSSGGHFPHNEGKCEKENEIASKKGKEFAHKWCSCC